MFKKDSFQPVISVSLTWETFEQYALWQLLLGNFMYSVHYTLVYIVQFTRYNVKDIFYLSILKINSKVWTENNFTLKGL